MPWGWNAVTGWDFLVLQAGLWQQESHVSIYWFELQLLVSWFHHTPAPRTHSSTHSFSLFVRLCWSDLPLVHPPTPDSLQKCQRCLPWEAFLDTDAENLCTSAKWNLGDRVLSEVEKNSFIALPGKGGHSRLVP